MKIRTLRLRMLYLNHNITQNRTVIKTKNLQACQRQKAPRAVFDILTSPVTAVGSEQKHHEATP